MRAAGANGTHHTTWCAVLQTHNACAPLLGARSFAADRASEVGTSKQLLGDDSHVRTRCPHLSTLLAETQTHEAANQNTNVGLENVAKGGRLVQ